MTTAIKTRTSKVIRNRKPAAEMRTPAQIEAELARIHEETLAHIQAELAAAAGTPRTRSEQARIADLDAPAADPEYEAWKAANGLAGRLSRASYVEEFAIY